MPVSDDTCVQDRLRELSRQLRGPARVKSDLLAEAQHALLDAAEAYRGQGMSAGEAGRRATAEFGTPAELVPAYQAELSAAAMRGLARRVLCFVVVVTLGADLTWRGAPSAGAAVPPAQYGVFSATLPWVWAAVALLALLGLLLGRVQARNGRAGLSTLARTAGFALTAAITLGVLGNLLLSTWSLVIWQDLLRWPPMLVGIGVLGAGQLWIAGAARSWLVATR